MIRRNRWIRRLLRSLMGVLVTVAFLLFLARIVIAIPAVQNGLVRWAEGFLAQEMGTGVSVGEIDMGLPVQAVLRDVVIQDESGLEMFVLSQLRIDMLGFSVWNYLRDQEATHALSIRNIVLVQPRIQLYRRKADGRLNLQFILDKFTGNNNSSMTLDLASIRLEGGRVTWVDSTHAGFDSLAQGYINYHNLHAEDIQLNLSLLMGQNNQMDLQLNQLAFRERNSGFMLDHLGLALISDPDSTHPAADGTPRRPYVLIQDLSLQVGRTWLLGSCLFPGKTLATAFSGPDFRYEARLDEGCRLDFESLTPFLEAPLPVRGEVYLTGPIHGTADMIETSGLALRYMDETRLKAALRIERLLEPESSYMTIRMEPSEVSMRELQVLLPEVPFPPILYNLRTLALTGTWDGGYDDFQVAVDANTPEGRIAADMHMALPPAAPDLVYEGSFATTHLDLNALGLADMNISRDLTLHGVVQGSGSETKNLSLKASLQVSPSALLSSRIDTLTAAIQYEKGLLAGSVAGRDAEGEVDLVLAWDTRTADGVAEAAGRISRINLQRWGLSEMPLLLTAGLDASLKGQTLDQLAGGLEVRDASLYRKTDGAMLTVPALSLLATRRNRDRSLSLVSSVANADLTGEFSLSQAVAFSRQLGEEIVLYLNNQDSVTQAYYAQLQPDTTAFNMAFRVVAEDSLNTLLAFLQQPLRLAPGSEVNANIQYDPETGTQEVLLTVACDTISYADVRIDRLGLDVNLFKQARAPSLLLAGVVSADSLRVGQVFELDRLTANIQGAENKFSGDFSAVQPQAPSRIQLSLQSVFEPEGKVRLTLDDQVSYITIQADTLRFSEGGAVEFRGNTIDVHNVVLQDANRYLAANGTISDAPDSRLSISLAQLDMGFLEQIYPFGYHPGGKLNADIELLSLLSAPEVFLLSRIDQFALDEYVYGQVFINGSWRESTGIISLDSRLRDSVGTTLVLEGEYVIPDTVSPLDFELVTRHDFPLDYIYPFVKTQLYGIKGAVELDKFTITGTLDDININGKGHFKDAGFGVDYFKTSYTFNGDIIFDKNRITFPVITLYDQNNNKADFHGTILHQGLTNFTFDLQLDKVSNFLVMNTKRKDNEYFYGTLLLKDGIADITGDLSKITVQAIAATGQGSELKIPLDYDTEYGRPEYIRFKEETPKSISNQQAAELGFEINLTALATEDLEIEMIFNERTGDIIRGRGNGNLTIAMNETGELTMYGDYEITRGDYLFTSQNVINKKFQVKEGGRIVFDGDPFQARLDMDAIYPVNADISALLQQENTVRVPANVLMHLEGSLMQPGIGLAIELPNLTEEEAGLIASYLKTIQYDEQELNKQVFSLMVFGRFAPAGGLNANISEGVTTSISELLSNQLNYWLSQVTNDKVNINVNTTDFQDVNLLVSASLFNDRVTIERNGNLVDQNSNFSVGNISVIIKLLPRAEQVTPTGGTGNELVMEVFNRENFAGDQRAGVMSNQTGIGVFYKRDFDRVKELFKKKP
ncbi:MAG: translocation/assembly module TamB domain-containing protein [Bacteroidia bacterium]|nr:translocation/assembly module TamB domain-containing protein [Bacteroidia bacterium]